jgi:NTP pyrophosphatase (non-canonical NTP hydrolase)
MNEKLRKIINHYGIDKQLKYLQSEIFELNEAIIKKRNTGVMERIALEINKAVSPLPNIKNVDYSEEHIKEEIADVMVMLKQFQLYYDIPTEDIKAIMRSKVDRQLERIEYEPKHGKEN